jgi:hypothetical protein
MIRKTWLNGWFEWITSNTELQISKSPARAGSNKCQILEQEFGNLSFGFDLTFEL